MNRYILIRRLTGPAVLLLLGIVALLSQAHVMRFGMFFPLLLILLGGMKLAERAALAGWQYPGAPEPYGVPYAGQANVYGSTAAGPASTSIVPAPELGRGGNDAGEGKL